MTHVFFSREKNITPDQMAERHIMNTGQCINWTKYISKSGYGDVRINGKTYRVHRVEWEKVMGKIPNGFQIDHLCRNRACVKIDHMELVTNKENLRRGNGICALNSRKSFCIKGHPYSEKNTYQNRRGRVCRTCMREWTRNHWLKHSKSMTEYSKKYQKRNRKKINEQRKLLRLENIETVQQYFREYRAKNREHLNRLARESYQRKRIRKGAL